MLILIGSQLQVICNLLIMILNQLYVIAKTLRVIILNDQAHDQLFQL